MKAYGVIGMSFLSLLLHPVSSLPSSPTSSCCPGNDPYSYCDSYETKCISCKETCENPNEFEDCKQHCSLYLNSVIIKQKVMKGDLETLTVMVTLTAVMTCVVMLAVFVLICMKLKRRRRLRKKIDPSTLFTVDKEKVEISVKGGGGEANNRITDTLKVSNLPPTTNVRPSLNPGTSMSTMVTQLSQESGSNSNIPMQAYTNSRTLSSSQRKSRQPSEDCIPMNNPATPRVFSEVI